MALGTRKIAIRLIIVTFWVGVLFLFLFFSRVTKRFEKERSIKIFTFPLLIDAQRLSLFEAETGIKLYIHYYENNDELLAKMRSTKQHGYDVVFPSDYAAQILIDKGLVQKIDRSKLDFWKQLHPKLLGHYFDLRNEFSIPFQWEVYGLGRDKDFFGGKVPAATWRLIFDQEIVPPRLSMINNAREVVALAAFYLFGRIDNLDESHIEPITQLLIKQKNWVYVYTDLRADYLLSTSSCHLAVCTAGDVWRLDAPGLEFIIPKEGSFVVIDSVCIPSECTKQNLVYQLLNYLYKPDVMEHHTFEYQLWPATQGVSVDKRGEELMHSVLDTFEQFRFFRPGLSERQRDAIWFALKAE